MAEQIKIRKGARKDLHEVLRLVRELAEYERAPNEVVVTLEEMEADGFGENLIFEFYVAELCGKIAGMALFYMKYSTWKGRCMYLDDIIVEENYRRKGIGKLLMDAVIEEAKKRRVRKLEWQVLNWNTPAINFYKKYKTLFDDEWINCKLTYEQLQRL